MKKEKQNNIIQIHDKDRFVRLYGLNAAKNLDRIIDWHLFRLLPIYNEWLIDFILCNRLMRHEVKLSGELG